MDTLTKTERSRIMGLVKSKNTKPEIVVRKVVSSLGFRYRLHVDSLPGRPDMVLRKNHKIIFVHGCFWHRHKGCPACRTPKSRLDFWKPKLHANRIRDLVNQKKLERLKWRVHIVWECETENISRLKKRLARILKGPK